MLTASPCRACRRGKVFAGNNAMSGAVNPGIGGAISSISLGSGWGSTASVSAIQSFGSSYSFTITAAERGRLRTR